MQKDNPVSLEDIEGTLAESRPFGDCDYIHRCTWRHLERRIEMLKEQVPSAGALLDAVRGASLERRYRVLGDAAVRGAVHGALAHYKLDIEHPRADDLDAVFRDALPFLAVQRGDTPFGAADRGARRLGEAHHHGWIHGGKLEDTSMTRSFTALWESARTDVVPKEPTEREQLALRDGVRLLEALLPRLARSALAHTHWVVVADALQSSVPWSAGFSSMTAPGIFGVICLSPRTLKTAWSVAEYLLHESLHLKFMDIEQTHSMLRPGYRVDSSPIIRPAWHRIEPDGLHDWRVHRCLTVMHVYTALALFFRAVEQRAAELEGAFGPLGGLDPVLEARRSFDRARFLGRELERHEGELGAAGKRFVAWLRQTLDAFDPCPAPEDSDAHLLLDLYDREAASLRNELAARGAPPPSVARLVDAITVRDVAKAREVLAALGEEPPVRPRVPEENLPPAARLWATRAWVTAQLRPAFTGAGAPARAGWGKAAALVRELLDGSGGDVRALFAEFAAR
ncbi:hypothetical protein WMF11_11885 [Sorangium sp. So ce295]|uniref:hypothetical protein n=1 Tax=Sorangium sp. So ce295 TaxID=3133295 RepID=UPI003F5FEE9C